MTKSYYLDSVTQQSFYGKAKVIVIDDVVYLKSYDTIVGFIKDGEFCRTWDQYSATTMKHIQAFLYKFDLPCGGKSWWNGLPVTEMDDLTMRKALVA